MHRPPERAGQETSTPTRLTWDILVDSPRSSAASRRRSTCVRVSTRSWSTTAEPSAAPQRCSRTTSKSGGTTALTDQRTDTLALPDPGGASAGLWGDHPFGLQRASTSVNDDGQRDNLRTLWCLLRFRAALGDISCSALLLV